MSFYKYFTDKESLGLTKDLMFKLERARELFNAPIIITSGYRDPAHNDNVGGVQDSSHTKGMAVDIRCHDKEMQIKLAWALGCAGFRRLGVYDKHVHVDCDLDKTTPAYWTGVSK